MGVRAWPIDRAGAGRPRGAVPPTRARAPPPAPMLEGEALGDDAIAEAANAAAVACSPVEDPATPTAYRRALVARLVRDALVRVRDGA